MEEHLPTILIENSRQKSPKLVPKLSDQVTSDEGREAHPLA